jgi:hypothetical protein
VRVFRIVIVVAATGQQRIRITAQNGEGGLVPAPHRSGDNTVEAYSLSSVYMMLHPGAAAVWLNAWYCGIVVLLLEPLLPPPPLLLQ